MYTNSNFDPRLCLATGEATTSADDSADRADVCSWQTGRNATFQLQKNKLSKGLVSDAGDAGVNNTGRIKNEKNSKVFPTIWHGKRQEGGPIESGIVESCCAARRSRVFRLGDAGCAGNR